ncbi:MAG: AAA family ATPase [Dialister invisus]|uniref:AAA family ATPase n=1 Tax=Dialister invisus TaxID=218538 RepID=UPI0039931787
MYISDVRIENYRTFQDVTFHFDSRANYIVGDNNIGKSNFLSFLKTVTHGYGFREADFLDENNPIHVFFYSFLCRYGNRGNLHISNFAS